MRTRKLQCITGIVDMASNQLTRCSDPRVTTGIKPSAGNVELHFPPDFRLMVLLASPQVANGTVGTNIPSTNNPQDANAARINHQSPPNVTNTDQVVFWVAFGAGAAG